LVSLILLFLVCLICLPSGYASASAFPIYLVRLSFTSMTGPSEMFHQCVCLIWFFHSLWLFLLVGLIRYQYFSLSDPSAFSLFVMFVPCRYSCFGSSAFSCMSSPLFLFLVFLFVFFLVRLVHL
jgi:hypothetical protein